MHQNSDRRVPKPECIRPSRIEHIVGENTEIMLHTEEPNSYIVYTIDGSTPCFTNGVRYEPERFPIIVPKDILSFTIKFVAWKFKMTDSEIWVRTFSVTKDAPSKIIPSSFAQSHAIRAAHEAPIENLALGLETPSDSNATPQHPGRSSYHNIAYAEISRPNEEDKLSDDSDEI